MIAFIDKNREEFGVEAIRLILGATECGFINSRGCRAFKGRSVFARSVRDEMLVEEVKQIYQESYDVYGVRKMWHAIRHAGWGMGRDQVARLMKIAGLQGFAEVACSSPPAQGPEMTRVPTMPSGSLSQPGRSSYGSPISPAFG